MYVSDKIHQELPLQLPLLLALLSTHDTTVAIATMYAVVMSD